MSTTLALVIISGIATGAIYSLIALSIVIVYKASDAVNFAAGEFTMVGAYIALFFIVSASLPYYLIFPIVAAATFILGGAFERLVVVPITNRTKGRENPLIPIVIATFGLSLMLTGFVRVFPYTEEVRSLPPLIRGAPIFVGGVPILLTDIAIVVVAVTAILGFWLFFSYTMLGKALQASSQNPRTAALSGIPVAKMRMIVWAIAGLMAGVSGMLVGPKLALTPNLGGIIMIAIAAAVIGGFSNLPGSILGGFIVGVVQNLIGYFFGSTTIAVAPFLIIMVVLLFRPQGLFGGPVHVKKV
ncbi:branched-chain amino acid ABC transporter permease [Chelativorans sp. ZYF759]|uniref:branched-chain amino acid ABC transporter permease n=1 Tax=Chelativorans sp. ZYF759 TaxID=2692213 RepID=UPI00145EEBD7|nr:branched-chain amino acid ABC transporter permease [Chelativorans sp. ZYF759]NMG41693.1 branched-chain amino acid ABC transporter permease [Chelativorans sp. ZYF759]